MGSNDIVIRTEGDTRIAVVLQRRVTGADSEDSMWQTLRALVETANPGPLILDWGQVQHVSSLGLGQLLTLAKRCRESRKPLLIRGLCPSLKHLFQLLRVDAVLDIEADGKAAQEGAP